jgi:hypothetical protein
VENDRMLRQKFNNSIFEKVISARKSFSERKREFFKEYFDDRTTYQKKMEVSYKSRSKQRKY